MDPTIPWLECWTAHGERAEQQHALLSFLVAGVMGPAALLLPP